MCCSITPNRVQTDRHHCFKPGKIPKTEGIQIHVCFVTVMRSQWNSTDTKRGLLGVKVFHTEHALTYPPTTVLGYVVVPRLSPLLQVKKCSWKMTFHYDNIIITILICYFVIFTILLWNTTKHIYRGKTHKCTALLIKYSEVLLHNKHNINKEKVNKQTPLV